MKIKIIDNRTKKLISRAIIEFDYLVDFDETCDNLAKMFGEWTENILIIEGRLLHKRPKSFRIVIKIAAINNAYMFTEILFFIENIVKVAYNPIKAEITEQKK